MKSDRSVLPFFAHVHDSYIQKWCLREFLTPQDQNVSLFNEIWDDSGEGSPGTNVFSSGKVAHVSVYGRHL